jgi:hypothetical protein
MSTPPALPDATTGAKRSRFRFYFTVSLIPVGVWVTELLGGGRGYDANRRPDLLDFAMTVSSYLVIPALYGLFAIAALLDRPIRAGRGYFIGAVVVGLVATAFALKFDLAFSGIDCRPDDCVPAVPDPGYYKAAYAASLVPAVVLPLMLALARWPKPEGLTRP